MEPDAERQFEKQVVVLEENRILRAVGTGLLATGPLAFVLALEGVFPPGFLGFHMAVFGAVLRTTQLRTNHRATKRTRDVRATSEGVFVDGKLAVPVARVADGFYQPRRPAEKEKYGSSVRLVSRRRSILFEAEMEEREALDFLHGLGLDPGSRRAEFGGGSPLFSSLERQLAAIFGVLGLMVAVAILGGALHPALFFAAFLLLPAVFLAMLPSKITVGIDGVLVRWLWTREFIPMKEIDDVVEESENAIRLRLRSGKERVVFTSMHYKQGNTPVIVQDRDAILARIREAHRMHAAAGEAVDATALVARGAQTRREWLASLERLARHDGGYRDPVVRSEDLVRIIEDPTAPEDARAGAALVLRRSADEEARARVRIAAAASASPKLRVALDAAVAGTDETIEEALTDLVPEDANEA